MSQINLELKHFAGVIIMHNDIETIKKENIDLLVYYWEFEKEAVSGTIKSERLIQAELSFYSLSMGYKEWALKFHQ